MAETRQIGALPPHPTAETLCALGEEFGRSRRRFPRNRNLTVALTGKVGELCVALLQGRSQSAREAAVTIAAVALRIYEEGDSMLVGMSPEERS